MIYTKAAMEDVAQLTELRLAYLAEDFGELKEKDFEAIKRDLPEYFTRNLNKNIFGYVAKNGGEIIS
ncbi:MAG: hypothetical protein K2J68_05435, partial [Treponemataceae bacterium]|nr:hypothetical protein [Treponemataceae bacterium]